MADRRNVILIGMDDAFAFWRYRTAFGATLHTPNLDRICANSALFTSAYCQVPICGPSRASAMSGLSPYATGIFDNYTNIFDLLRPEQMWQYRLRQAGYHCATAGKIHHGYKPLPPAVHDTLYSHPAAQVYFGPKRDAPAIQYGGRMNGAGTTDTADDRAYYDYRSSQHAIRFLKSYDAAAPFYREVGFHHPHPPFRTPDRFKQMYPVEDFIQPADWAQGFDLNAFTATFMQENMDTAGAVEDWQKSVRNYFSAFSHVDSHIGRVWDALKASPHADDTVVVIFSDHGYHMGDKNRFRKFTLWEEATRVPLIVHDPRQPARVVDDPVALLDLGPTILDYAGARPMRHAVGTSLRPLVEGGRAPDRAVPTFWYGSASIRQGDLRVTLYQDGTSALYDVTHDPWLTTDLGPDHPHYAKMRSSLLATCRDYGLLIAAAGDPPHSGTADYISVHDGGPPLQSLPTNGVITVGSAPAGLSAPGHRKHFATLRENGTLDLADGIRELLFASDTNGGVTRFRIQCNDAGNRIFFAGGHNRFALDVVGGDGGDDITTSSDSLTAHLGRGENRVHAGVSDATIHGGEGQDTIHAIDGNNLIHGGSGNAVIFAGMGNDTIYSGGGVNMITTGPGQSRITLDAGQNTIDATQGITTLIFLRTGLPQLVRGFRTGVIDLSDWAVMGPVRIRQVQDDVVLTCGTESLRLATSRRDDIAPTVTGVVLTPRPASPPDGAEGHGDAWQ
ncbi:sulfatase-like hydrolase/transferase [Pseudooceanicola sediminis]|nr:sulfatase-like hydrolase/transferase [Pseudooceanicola sediminis]